ncbi:hypothetical protein L6164_015227 [Bauhinia variegata]|uniref:Uncharacterized protein n=1 Tax=Bauhinia variegata TaxID=167791 RepID=A0ACB9NNM3_BAUVA|nr:hypothetical protein L6164_015227 [Bauhinia variegata]
MVVHLAPGNTYGTLADGILRHRSLSDVESFKEETFSEMRTLMLSSISECTQILVKHQFARGLCADRTAALVDYFLSQRTIQAKNYLNAVSGSVMLGRPAMPASLLNSAE